MAAPWVFAEYVAEQAVQCLVGQYVSPHFLVMYGGLASALAAERSAQLQEFSAFA